MIVVSGKCFRERRHCRHLGMVLPSLETQTQTVQPGKALSKTRSTRRDPRAGRYANCARGVGSKPPACRIPRKRAGAAAMCASSTSFDRGSQGEIGEADDTRRDPSLAVSAARALRRDAVDESVSPTAASIRGRPRDTSTCIRRIPSRARDARVGVAENLVEHVAAARMVPQMMMGIDDRHLRPRAELR